MFKKLVSLIARYRSRSAKDKYMLQDLVGLIEKHQLEVDSEELDLFDTSSQGEMNEQLFNLFYQEDIIDHGEQGCSPAEYLPGLAKSYLQRANASGWQLKSLESSDGWLNANMVFLHDSGREESYQIKDIDNSDWVPGDFFEQLRLFSQKNAAKTLMAFFSDDPYIVIALPHEVAEFIQRYYDENIDSF